MILLIRSVNSLKKYLKKIPFLVFAVRFVKKSINSLRQNYSGIDEAELAIFNAIKNDVEIVFDVGARLNTDYIDNSSGTNIKFYLFEPNPAYYKKLCKRVLNTAKSSKVEILNFGLGDKQELLTYYEDVQSFVKDNGFRKSEGHGAKLFEIRTLDDFCREKGISSIDFLKIDVEGLDYQVLLGGSSIIKKTCNYCQFEFGIGKTADGSTNTPEKYYQFFKEDFELFYIRNPQHPIHKEMINLTELTKLSGKFTIKIEEYLYNSYGCNILAVRKDHTPPIEFYKLLG